MAILRVQVDLYNKGQSYMDSKDNNFTRAKYNNLFWGALFE